MKNDKKGLESLLKDLLDIMEKDFGDVPCECAWCVKERQEARQEAVKDKKTEEVSGGFAVSVSGPAYKEFGEWLKEKQEKEAKEAKEQVKEAIKANGPGAPDVIEFKGDNFCFRKDSSGRPTIYFVQNTQLIAIACVDQTEGKYFLQLVESFKIGPYKICMAVKSPNGIVMDEGK